MARRRKGWNDGKKSKIEKGSDLLWWPSNDVSVSLIQTLPLAHCLELFFKKKIYGYNAHTIFYIPFYFQLNCSSLGQGSSCWNTTMLPRTKLEAGMNCHFIFLLRVSFTFAFFVVIFCPQFFGPETGRWPRRDSSLTRMIENNTRKQWFRNLERG